MKTLPMGSDDLILLSRALRKLSFFEGMSMGDLERFMGVAHLYEFEDGKTVFKKGDVGDALYVVHSGAVKVIVRPVFFLPAKIIATLGSGEFFGEMALLDQPYRTATVITQGPTKLFALLISNIDGLLNENPVFAKQIRQVAKQRAFERKHQ